MASLEHKLGSALAVCSESEARTLQFRRAERALSVGLEVECWLPDLRRVLPKLRSIRSNEELFAAVAEAEPAVLSARGAYAGFVVYCLDFSPYSVDFHSFKRVYETPRSAHAGCSPLCEAP